MRRNTWNDQDNECYCSFWLDIDPGTTPPWSQFGHSCRLHGRKKGVPLLEWISDYQKHAMFPIPFPDQAVDSEFL